MAWLLVLPLAIALGLLGYWLVVSTEGVYLGQKMVVYLYDRVANEYDDIKEYDPEDEYYLVSRPVLAAIAGIENPLVLDVATGTGRVPYNLFEEPTFTGRVIALDASKPMLDIAAYKLSPYQERLELHHLPAVPLPFPDDHFDVVTCLEALEFFPSAELALREMVRVLRPGHTLITTRRRGLEGKLFLHRYRTADNFTNLLQSLNLTHIKFHPWQVNYDLVTAHKPPIPDPQSPIPDNNA